MRRQAKRLPIAGRDGNPIIEELRKTDKDSGVHTYNLAVCQIDLLLSKRHIDDCQHAAATRFTRDYELSEHAPSRAVEIKERVSGGGVTLGIPDRTLDAKERVMKALLPMNTVSRLLLLDVCVDGLNYQAIAAKRGFSHHYVGPRFREALDDLAKHYGLA